MSTPYGKRSADIEATAHATADSSAEPSHEEVVKTKTIKRISTASRGADTRFYGYYGYAHRPNGFGYYGYRPAETNAGSGTGLDPISPVTQVNK